MRTKPKTARSKRTHAKPRRGFSTVQETLSHFFPEQKTRVAYVRGKECGTKAAERAFTEIAESVRS
jgi:hypothetical protein